MHVAASGLQLRGDVGLGGDPARAWQSLAKSSTADAPRCRSSREEAGNEWMAVTGDSPSACSSQGRPAVAACMSPLSRMLYSSISDLFRADQ